MRDCNDTMCPGHHAPTPGAGVVIAMGLGLLGIAAGIGALIAGAGWGWAIALYLAVPAAGLAGLALRHEMRGRATACPHMATVTVGAFND